MVLFSLCCSWLPNVFLPPRHPAFHLILQWIRTLPCVPTRTTTHLGLRLGFVIRDPLPEYRRRLHHQSLHLAFRKAGASVPFLSASNPTRRPSKSVVPAHHSLLEETRPTPTTVRRHLDILTMKDYPLLHFGDAGRSALTCTLPWSDSLRFSNHQTSWARSQMTTRRSFHSLPTCILRMTRIWTTSKSFQNLKRRRTPNNCCQRWSLARIESPLTRVTPETLALQSAPQWSQMEHRLQHRRHC